MRCLEKAPDERYPDAATLHDALQSAWRGAASSAEALPQPLGLEGRPRVYDFVWRLRASPEELWPHVSNTERLNRAAGLDEVEWNHSPGEGYVETEGRFRAAGMELRWKERPFEWVAPLDLGVVREYVSGPFQWLRSTVELQPSGGGTELRHRVDILPRGLLGRAAATVEVGLRLRRNLERVYRRIDDACVAARGRAGGALDLFEEPARVAPDLRARVDARLAHVVEEGGNPSSSRPSPSSCAARPSRGWPAFGRGSSRAARLRGRTGARRVLHRGVQGYAGGALGHPLPLVSDPERDRGVAAGSLQEHGRCEVCESRLRAGHGALGGARVPRASVDPPGRRRRLLHRRAGSLAPRLAQVRLVPGERFALELASGRAAIGSRAGACPRAGRSRWTIRAALSTLGSAAAGGPRRPRSRRLKPGSQLLLLTNDLGHEVVIRRGARGASATTRSPPPTPPARRASASSSRSRSCLPSASSRCRALALLLLAGRRARSTRTRRGGGPPAS